MLKGRVTVDTEGKGYISLGDVSYDENKDNISTKNNKMKVSSKKPKSAKRSRRYFSFFYLVVIFAAILLCFHYNEINNTTYSHSNAVKEATKHIPQSILPKGINTPGNVFQKSLSNNGMSTHYIIPNINRNNSIIIYSNLTIWTDIIGNTRYTIVPSSRVLSWIDNYNVKISINTIKQTYYQNQTSIYINNFMSNNTNNNGDFWPILFFIIAIGGIGLAVIICIFEDRIRDERLHS